MKLTEYKFAYIKRDDDGVITEAAVRFYEGEMLEMPVLDVNNKQTGTEIRYVRQKRLKKEEITHIKEKFIKEREEDVKIYTVEDFGKIKTDDELRVFFNGELRKDKNRTPIEIQNTLDISKVK